MKDCCLKVDGPTGFSAILSTGGWTYRWKDAIRSTEVLVPKIGFRCYLPDLPLPRNNPVQQENTVCGGYSGGLSDPYKVSKTCIRFENCQWKPRWNLYQERWMSTLFKSPGSIIDSFILNGRTASITTEIVNSDNTTTRNGFNTTDNKFW